MTPDTEQRKGATAKTTIATPTDREIVSERIFEAPRDLVFEVVTDPKLIPQWWGPHGTTTIVDKMEVRPGGDWRFVVRSEDGSESGFHGTYREIDPPERIVQTFEWEGMPGHVIVETAVYTDLGDGRTKLTNQSLFHTTEERDGMLGLGMERGMKEMHERLDAVLANKIAM